jgi:hypothetical protein
MPSIERHDHVVSSIDEMVHAVASGWVEHTLEAACSGDMR